MSAAASTLASHVASLASNSRVRNDATKHGLAVQNISWEDSARFKGSCWGPNISDMTLRLASGSSTSGPLLPMIRYPNFQDMTCDTPMERFMITVGNETSGESLKRIPLKEYLENVHLYLGGDSKSERTANSLYCAEKDASVLTSAQYCILPLNTGTTEFNVNLYNYQSSSSSPAVLVLVCSQKGTSAQAIFGGTTQLYFNNAGDACNYVAERLKEERKRLGKALDAPMDNDEKERNALFIFQIPLKTKEPTRSFSCSSSSSSSSSSSYTLESCESCEDDESCEYDEEDECDCEDDVSFSLESSTLERKEKKKGIDHAMLSIGKSHSKFVGVKDHKIERDTRFPIRVTIQFYLATDSREVSDEMWKEMNLKINGVYKKGESFGSLVTQLDTGRKTEWDAMGKHKEKEFSKTLPASEAAKPMFNAL